MNVALSPVDAVTILRERVWDAGYRPVAVYGPDAPGPSPGKRPMGHAWQERARQDPPEAAELRADPLALNTGILCDGLRAVDVDVDDPARAHAVRDLAARMLGHTITRTRENSARALLLYQAAEGAPPKRTVAGTFGKVEVLGCGNQFVAFGLHPSGADLVWSDGAPDDTPFDTLPAVDEATVGTFLAAAGALIGAEVQAARQTGGGLFQGLPRQPSDLGPCADPLDVAAALGVIPNAGPADWESWNTVGMAAWAATGGSMAGFAAWCAWSAKNPAHDDAATGARWDHYRTSPPTRSGAGTLFHMARQACPGWVRPSEQKAPAPEQLPPAEPRPDLAAFLALPGWMAREIEAPEPLLGEIITNTTRMFIGGPTGLGKSHLGFGMAAGLATGHGFAHWQAARACRVLYIDGEMARDLVQERLGDLRRRMMGADLSHLHVLCTEDCEELGRRFPELGSFGPLNTAEGQAFLLRLVEMLGGVDVVFFDNRMSLLSGDMKEEQPWTDTMPLVKELSRRRIAQVWIDHTGHQTGHIYGSKTKEWSADAVALMSKAERPGMDIAFKLEWTKARRRKPSNRADFATVTLTMADDAWSVEGADSAAPKDGFALTLAERGWLGDVVDLFAAPGAAVTLAPVMGMTPVVTLTREQVRRGLMRKGRIGEKGDSKGDASLTGAERQKLSKYLNTLKDKRKIGLTDDHVWLL